MSLDLATRLKELLASAPRNIRAIQTLEISHSAMTQTYYLWREPYLGTMGTEDGSFVVEPVNMEIKLAGAEGHLDQSYTINIDTVDINDEFREQMDLIPLDTQERIRCVYREYLSDDLSNAGIMASAVLQVEAISYNVGVATISAITPKLNVTRTGELYVPRDVPMLRGFL
jgi:hypothetical protein